MNEFNPEKSHRVFVLEQFDGSVRASLALQKTGIGPDHKVYLDGARIGSVEQFKEWFLASPAGYRDPRGGPRIVRFTSELNALKYLVDMHELTVAVVARPE